MVFLMSRSGHDETTELAPPGNLGPSSTSESRQQELPALSVFDIDGVLADVRHRLPFVSARPKDWEGFFGAADLDELLPEGAGVVRAAESSGSGIAYLTGRPERCRASTVQWLARHSLPEGQLVMRADDDRRPARLWKVAALRRLSRRNTVAAFVDDDAAVVKAVRAAGFPVMHARWMDDPGSPESANHVLFSIQEEGNT